MEQRAGKRELAKGNGQKGAGKRETARTYTNGETVQDGLSLKTLRDHIIVIPEL